MRILFIILFFPSLQLEAQNIVNGKYCTPSDMVGHCITFHSKAAFTYEFWGCLGSSKSGQGIYKIKDDSLFLMFSSKDTSINQYLTSNITTTDNDSIVFNFSIYDKADNSKMDWAGIKMRDKEDSLLYSTRTDTSGNATIKLKKSNSMLTLSIQYLGYKSTPHYIIPDSNKNISAFIVQDKYHHEFENGTMKSYKILEIKKNRLMLQEYGGNLSELTRR